MSRALRFLMIVLALLCGALAARAAQDEALERGLAISDPSVLRDLDGGRLGLGRMMSPQRSGNLPLDDAELFALPSMAPVRAAIDREFDRYIARHEQSLPNETIGVGDSFAFQLFDRAQLYSAGTRFVLAGIVNRMDRAYVSPESCGEIRLIYRLTRIDAPVIGENAVSQRLPMTLNLVLKAKGEGARDRSGAAITCREIARRWLAIADVPSGEPGLEKLAGKDGPLDLISERNIEQIETNLQIAHAPKSPVREFRTDYLLKVFNYNSDAGRFEEAPLENQIDRDRILADENLKREFKSWLLDPRHFAELDRGTLLIPEKFLARAAIAPTPVGFDVSELQPEYGMMRGENDKAAFDDNDVVGALKRATEDGTRLQNIRSVAGFERRLNDVTCAGCHQTRGIGGFHFPGVDWMAAKPSNTTVVPASPHFFGDQLRRRDILAAFARGAEPDFSRGFSNRPQLRGSTELAGTEYDDGWGAHCYQQGAKTADNDRSFRNWTCAEGLACQVAGKTSRIGMCFIKSP
jgi:mono/diheme cytochrome c family protein